MILRQRVQRAIVLAREQIGDTLIVIREVDLVISRYIIIKCQKNVILHIHLCYVGMHPENIRHTGLI